MSNGKPRKLKKSHLKEGQYGQCCLTRGNTRCKCPDKNDYRECDPAVWEDDAIYKFWQGRRRFTQAGYQAHHVVCVSSVNTLPQDKETAKRVADVLHETRWCINNLSNMLAMPVWGQTVRHYSNISSTVRILLSNEPLADTPAPPFANIPQHDIHHNDVGGYTDDITKEIQRIYKQIDNMQQSCELKTWSLVQKLNTMSKKWKFKLNHRGTRGLGTHEEWKAAEKDRESTAWILPFSMASAAFATKRAFPFSEKAQGKLAKIVKSMLGKRVI